MHQESIISRLETLLSANKINPYKQKYGNNWFKIYKAELMQAKEIFSHLHFLEIFLRNKIAIELSQDFHNWLFDENILKLNIRDRIKIDNVFESLKKLGKEANQDNIISNLNFGFWTNLFHKSYNSSVWQRNKMIKRVFPFLKDHQRNLKKIQQDLENIRKFRNRIFHFENLCNCDFLEMKRIIAEFIFGVSGIEVEVILSESLEIKS